MVARACGNIECEQNFGACAAETAADLRQRVVGFTLTAANVDERSVLDNFIGKLRGLLIGDKGLLSKSKQIELAKYGINLQTPLRDNMPDTRPPHLVQMLLKTRRRGETVIGQLTEFFGFSSCKARDMWHLQAKLLRKILAYNFTKN